MDCEVVVLLNEMAFHRSDFQNHLRKILSGALGEYAKLVFATEIGIGDFWSNEIRSAINKAESFFDEKKIKTKSKFNRIKAAKEVFNEVKLMQDQIISAKNDMKSYMKTQEERVSFIKRSNEMNLDSSSLFDEMIDEFSDVLSVMNTSVVL